MKLATTSIDSDQASAEGTTVPHHQQQILQLGSGRRMKLATNSIEVRSWAQEGD
jgi:hypothetical protein